MENQQPAALAALTLSAALSCSDSTVKPTGDTKAADSAPIAELIPRHPCHGGDAVEGSPWGTTDDPAIGNGPMSPDAALPTGSEGYGAVTKGAA